MLHRIALLSGHIAAIWIFLASGPPPLAAAEAQPNVQTQPNVVLIISDDQAWTDYGFMGHEVIRTPNLDQLAKQSVLFRRGYVPTALCRPSLMTLVTGLYAHQHGTTGNDPSPKYADPDSDLYHQRRAALIESIDNLPTLPKWLDDRGYLSHQSGKWWEGSFRRGGFTHGMTRGFPKPGGRHGDDGLKIGREGMAPIRTFVDDAIEQQKPFFLWYAPFLPHTPHNPPQRILDHYANRGLPESVAKYYAMCEWFDESCGELLGLLDEKEVRDQTLVVYVTDNGWIQDPTGWRYAPRSKQTPYEGGVRTPIMFSWPNHLSPQERNEVISSIDIVPTILAAADVSAPQNLPGINLLPTLTTGNELHRGPIFGEAFAHDIADIRNPEASLIFRWCIDKNWKLLLTYDGETHRYASTHPREERRPQLFNLKDDPTEQHNLAAEHPEVVSDLVGKIGQWYPVTKRQVVTVFSDDAGE